MAYFNKQETIETLQALGINEHEGAALAALSEKKLKELLAASNNDVKPEKKKTEKKQDGSNKVKVRALKNFRIVFNEIDIQLREGEECEVPEMFIPNLITEKVIEGGVK